MGQPCEHPGRSGKGGAVFSCAMFLYLSAKMLRTKKDLHMAAAAKPSQRQVPKSKESLPVRINGVFVAN